MHVKYGEHRNEIGFQCEIHGVRKNSNDRSPNAFLNDRKLERIVDEPSEDGINLRFEADTQADALALVSKCGLKISSSASDETSSRHIQRAVRRRARSSSRIPTTGAT